MGARKIVAGFKRLGPIGMVTLSFLIATIISAGSVAQAAPYGGCNYSANTYGGSESCEPNETVQSGQSGPLSDTGDNYLRLLYGAIGLLVFIGGAAVVMRLLVKKHSRGSSV